MAEAGNEKEIGSQKAKIESLSARLDEVYMDKRGGIAEGECLRAIAYNKWGAM